MEEKRVATEFEEVLLEMNDIYSKRNEEYGNSFSDLIKELGVESGCVQIIHKANRLKNEMKKGRIKEDTLIDLANYAVMELIEVRKQKEVG